MNPGPIFDFHARLAPRPDAYDRLLATMDRLGIERAVVSGGGMIGLDQLSAQVYEGGYVTSDADNDAVLAGCRRAQGRLVPFFFGNPHRGPGEYRRRAGQFRGLELAPAVHGVGFEDERTDALVTVAEGAGQPVYVGCLMRPGVTVVDLIGLAKRFPDTTFVLGHLGFINIDLYALNLVEPQGNVVVETSGGYTCVLRAALDRLGADRVLFGSEYPLQHPTVELAKVRALELAPEIRRQVVWSNARRLLGEERP